MLCYNTLQLVFCAEIFSSPLLAQDSIRVGYHKSRVFCWARCSLHMHSFVGIPSSALSLFARLCRGSFAIWLLGAPVFCCLFCTRLLFSFTGRHRFVTFDRYRTVKSCPMAQKRSTCESHVNESQRLRMLDHHLSRMTRTHANWVVIALYGKGKWNQMLLFRESGKVLAGLDSLFLGHFGSNDC